MSSTSVRAFESLAAEARKCCICEAMRDKTAVLSKLNGNLDPRVFFVAEAPGRQGADRTRRPFYGDKSGENFQVLLDSIDLKRDDIFITNSVLCSPRKPNGANRRPLKSEMNNCSDYLRRTLQLIDPRLIVPLGSVALEALGMLEPHNLTLKTGVGRVVKWNKRELLPLYHPSPQVIASHRNLEAQLKDYAVLGKALTRLGI
ncbi:MAG: uracil-DNA glycosylase [Acidobacteria bacterium]|nr:MAG: uracil-DNA glycosylase [Acidobacteriota bacterium]REK01811.1 MAG: uracil-DNA glycosylase [Acidobacteriota bacterium]REK14767.1 MAG: uracil-DNA glycosylase [Acidobacteriota bacterium]REK45482.1 MAG: uracil-DNA glycosylase [Acidobacteriota bacterium]